MLNGSNGILIVLLSMGGACSGALGQVLQERGGAHPGVLSQTTRDAVASILKTSDPSEPPPAICLHPDDQAASDLVFALVEQLRGNDSRYILNDRWSSTATEGGGLNDGDPTILTYSFVPDGTSLDGAGASNLQSFMNGIIGPGQWQPIIQQALDGWGAETGLTYVLEPNDDGVPQSGGAVGIVGVRGDVRIGGSFLDGNGGVLAYNFFPNHGDMVLDTGDSSFYGNGGGSHIRLRNVIAHEAGHGIGLSHVESSSDAFLMEPFINISFDGPQIDDIRGGQRGYGDMDEHNDSYAAATDFEGQSRGAGLAPGDSRTLEGRSIDDGLDEDYFFFETTGSVTADFTLSPRGGQYQIGSQGGGQSAFDADARIDLRLDIADSSQSVIASVDATGLGQSESLSVDLTGTGPHYAIVSGTDSSTQLYQLDLSLTGSPSCNDADLAEPFGVLDFSDVVAFLGAFGAMDSAADLAAPFGVWDFSDVVAFLGAFGAGCP